MFTKMLKGFTIVGLVAGGGIVSAHHSYSANYDGDQLVTLEGTVRAFDFTSPHSEISLVVVNADGTTTDWLVDGPSPSRALSRDIPISADTLETGMVITASGWPARDGSNEIGGSSLTLADGTTIVLRDDI